MKNYLKDNIVDVLAIMLVLFIFIFELILLLSQNLDANNSVMAILRINETLATLVVGYYFGWSRGSKRKQTKLDKIVSNY